MVRPARENGSGGPVNRKGQRGVESLQADLAGSFQAGCQVETHGVEPGRLSRYRERIREWITVRETANESQPIGDP
jgi:hypothetical protein